MTVATRSQRMARERAERALEYEQRALKLVAEHGFPNVTVEHVAAEVGVSTRTFFRYFRSKDDILLTLPRRQAAGLIQALQALEPSPDPVSAVWKLLIDMSERLTDGVEELALWMRAASEAPDVKARAAGERIAVIGVLTEYCARSLEVDPTEDIRPAVLAAALHSAEREVLAFWEQYGTDADLSELFAEAMDSLRAIGRGRRRLRAM